jgi:serine/threonine protein kinase
MDCADHPTSVLPSGAELLRGQYRIEQSLGQGGFGLTYLAKDSLSRTVVIKECFPAQICKRDGICVVPEGQEHAAFFEAVLAQFQAEAHRLAALDHPNIVSVHQTFVENGTAYTAMDFVEGEDLHDVVDHTPGRLTPAFLDRFFRQILDALGYLHDRGVLHRDIAPDNILLNANGDVTLIDFGAAYSKRDTALGHAPCMLAVKDGYSPPEFYDAEGAQGTFSDIYSMGALCHLILTGEAPPDAQTRLELLSCGRMDPYVPLESMEFEIDIRLRMVIDRALSLDTSERVKSVNEWLAIMDGPIPKPLPVFDPSVLEAIGELVSATNETITPGLPKALQAPDPAMVDLAQQTPGPKQYVDIFGDPIDDVEAYLKEQDRQAARRHKKTAKQIIPAPPEHAPDPSPKAGASSPQSGVGSLILRFRDRLKGDQPQPNTRLFLI